MEQNKQPTGTASQLAQVKAFLGDKRAVRQMLDSQEAQKIFGQLKKTDRTQLQTAAQAALQGDPAALGHILQTLSQNQETAGAIQTLDQKLNK